MKITQPIVEIVVQLATKTDKVNSDGEPLYRCGSTLYPESTLKEAFEKSTANVQWRHDGESILTFYKDPDVRLEVARHDMIYGGVLVSCKIEEDFNVCNSKRKS